MSVLDLPAYQGQRSATFTFSLIETATGRLLGAINPNRDRPPQLSHDTNSTIKRKLTGLILPADETASIDPVAHSVKVAMVLPDGTSIPKGQFVFVDGSIKRYTTQRELTGTLTDLSLIVDQPLTQSFSAAPGYTVVQAMRDVMALGVNTIPFNFEGSNAVLGAPFSVPIGTSQLKTLGNLAQLGGFFDVWVDNSGTLRAIQAFDPASRPVDFDYSVGTRDLYGTITETSDLLSAPNRFIVIDSATTAAAVVGVYDVPASAPHSRVKRGFVIPNVRTASGMGTNAQANAVAAAIAQQETIFERVSFSSPPDPRHDSYNVIRYLGANWLELAWTLTLAEGAPMTHLLRKAYGQ